MHFTYSTGTQAVVRSSDCSDTMKLTAMSRELDRNHPLTRNGTRELALRIADWAESLIVRGRLPHGITAQIKTITEQMYRLGDVVADHSVKDFMLMRTAVGQCYVALLFAWRAHA